MPDSKTTILSHFTLFRFTDRFWMLAPEERATIKHEWRSQMQAVAHTQLYQVYPTESSADLLTWSSVRASDDDAPASFFQRFACATTPFRGVLEPTTVLWGFTQPSQYSRARSRQEIDPMSNERKRYLVIYPFVKTTEWFLMGQEARQGMMNEHIRIGKEYTEITQLLLYSTGIQNQEFVVVYETDHLELFSSLVKDLRATEGRRYTERDTPLHTALYRPPEEVLGLFG